MKLYQLINNTLFFTTQEMKLKQNNNKREWKIKMTMFQKFSNFAPK